MTLDVDKLAQEIRRVDGKHSLGAGALAEALMPFFKEARNEALEEAAQTILETPARVAGMTEENVRRGFAALIRILKTGE